MGAYVAATVVTPSPVSVGLGGGAAYSSPSNANDGLDSTSASYTTPLVIGPGAINLGNTAIASIELRDWSASLGSSLQQIVIRARHSLSATYSGDTTHFIAGKILQSILQYSVDNGASWSTLIAHTSTAGAAPANDLVLSDHTDVLGAPLIGVNPSLFRMREVFWIPQFQTNASYTGGTITINSQMSCMEIIADTKMIAALMGFM